MSMKKSLLSIAIAAVSTSVAAETITPPAIEEIYVTGGAEAIRTLPGSASLIDDEAIKAFDSTDLTDLLGQVPGVYIRFEDGYGLRPNIGIRGATSDRSQKITLMEDGILIAPAPYAAPAAYYVPNVNRMAAVEVFKGPASIQYGPHTVGGALNMVTKPLPESEEGEIAATIGNDNYQKISGYYGDSFTVNNDQQLAYWVDALHYGADGFKELAGRDTGFVRKDFNAKVRWQNPNAAHPQTLTVKLGYADETSDETYLGLSDGDFAANPVQRYAASANDEFTSDHTQLHLLHSIALNSEMQLQSTAYINRFTREWNKFDGFWEPPEGGCGAPDCAPDVKDILLRADDFPREMAILRGQRDSIEEWEKIDLTNNARDYGSQGLSTQLNWDWQWGSWLHSATAGVRYHHDYVERHHSPVAHNMVAGELVADGIVREPKTLNKSEADALAVFAQNEANWDDFKITTGVRVERIEGTLTDEQEIGDLHVQKRTDTVVMPGVGVFYEWRENLGLLFGVNKGFSPSVAGSGAEPEESVNYEYGVRFEQDSLTLDAIGFYSDYSNLIGRCRVSDSGCNSADEFDGGAAIITGVELTSSWQADIGSLTMPVSFVYTYTDATFDSSFESDFSQWGVVVEGDELPYTPRHQANMGVGLESDTWSLKLDGKFTGRMREKPDQGSYQEGYFTRSYMLWNLAARYTPSDQWSYLLAAENLSDKQVIVSRRPFGARPNQPFSVKAGVTYSF